MPAIASHDGRRIEVLATGLPLYRGVPLAVDATLVSALHADGQPWAGAAERDGVAIQRGERAKRTTYPELVGSSVVRLVTLACEAGGRWSDECRSVLRDLAAFRARSAPPMLQRAARSAWLLRWSALLSVAQQDALAATLVDDVPVELDGTDGEPPTEVGVWLDGQAR